MTNAFELSEYFRLFGTNLLCAVLIAALCGFTGTFVVIRRLSFMADTLGHSALTGVALGYLLGVPTQAMVAILGVAIVIFLTWLSRNRKQDLVASTAVVFSVSVGIGVILLSSVASGGHDMTHILFGDLLWITGQDLLFVIIFGIPIVFFLGCYSRRIFLVFLNEDLARASSIPAGLYEYLFMICTAVLIAISIKLLGIILLTALITIPPMISSRFSHNIREQLFLSPLLGIICTLLGVAWSYWQDLPAGACVATMCGILFAVVVIFKRRPV